MKKNDKLFNWSRSKISLELLIAILGIFAVLGVGIMIFIYGVKNIKINTIRLTLSILLVVVICIFYMKAIDIIVDIIVDRIIAKRENEKSLKEVKGILDNSYKIVKYQPKNISETLKLYLEANRKMHITLHAKLDADDNICYAIKDCNGNVIHEIKNQKYRYFLDNFYVYGYFVESFYL